MKYLKRVLIMLTLTLTLAGSSAIESIEPVYAAAPEMRLYSIYLTVNPGETPEKDKLIGESALLESDGEYLLMDCGAPFASESVINYLKKVLPAGATLNVYISHFHKDHYGGFYKIAGQFNIGTVYLPDKETIGTEYQTDDTDCDIDTILRRNFYSRISEKQIVWLRQGSIFSVGSVSAKVLGPVGLYMMSDFAADKYGKQEGHYLNNSSLTTMFTAPSGIKFLTAGDIEAEEESNLAAVYGNKLKADIMKISHHALKTSTTELFTSMVRPTYAFAGNSGYAAETTSQKGNIVHKFHTSAKNIRKYGMFYMVGNEAASLGVSITNGKMQLYRDGNNDGSLSPEELLSGWTSVKGITARSLNDYTGNNNYYIDPKSGKPLTGVQHIGGKAYLFGSGGSLQRGTYTENGYEPLRWYGEKLRYFSEPDENGVASMNVGIQQIGKKYYYFKKKTGCRYTAKKGTDGSSWKVITISRKKYLVNIKDGRVYNCMTGKKAAIRLGKKKYTVGADGSIIKVTEVSKKKRS